MPRTKRRAVLTTVVNREIGGSIPRTNSANLLHIDLKWQLDWIVNKRKMRSPVSARCDGWVRGTEWKPRASVLMDCFLSPGNCMVSGQCGRSPSPPSPQKLTGKLTSVKIKTSLCLSKRSKHTRFFFLKSYIFFSLFASLLVALALWRINKSESVQYILSWLVIRWFGSMITPRPGLWRWKHQN